MKQQGIVGDVDTQIPQTEVPQTELDEEKKLAKYSKTAEFKRLKEFLEARIEYYQNFLPGSTNPIRETNIQEKDLPMYWKIATTIVGELQNIINQYEQAKEAVDDADRPKNS